MRNSKDSKFEVLLFIPLVLILLSAMFAIVFVINGSSESTKEYGKLLEKKEFLIKETTVLREEVEKLGTIERILGTGNYGSK